MPKSKATGPEKSELTREHKLPIDPATGEAIGEDAPVQLDKHFEKRGTDPLSYPERGPKLGDNEFDLD